MTWRRRLSALILGVTAGLTGLPAAQQPALVVNGLGDCEKITKDGSVPPSPRFWDPVAKRLSLHGGRNEVLGAQLILTATSGDLDQVDVEIGDLKGPGTIAADPNIMLFLEAYQYVEHGNWEGFATVLPEHKWYPDVLVPFQDPYSPGRHRVGAPFRIQTANGPNQGVWIDVYIPRTTRPGKYEAPVRVKVSGQVCFQASLVLNVHGFAIPDEFHVDGFGQVFGREYLFHKATYADAGVDRWWEVAKRYHQMAHQHRFVIIEVRGQGPDARDWDDFDKTYGRVLDGSAFSSRAGYTGPGENIGPSFWRMTCLGSMIGGKVPEFTGDQLRQYTDAAKAFLDHMWAKGWIGRRFFGLFVDEAGNDARAVENLEKLRKALDAGAGKRIDLMWTSHTNPARLAADPATDLRGIIRWWSPNGQACDPRFLAERIKTGETVWFYHHGHPANGVHAVNATGIDLRTWGTICWRYGLSGSFWWAVDFTDRTDPMTKPIYDPHETRWGNGVMFYSGARLPDIGFPAIDGPLSSLRMKAYRRGLQDYEYCWLLGQRGKRSTADQVIKDVIPVALTEAMDANSISPVASEAADRSGQVGRQRRAVYRPPWRTDVESWYQMRQELADELDKK